MLLTKPPKKPRQKRTKGSAGAQTPKLPKRTRQSKAAAPQTVAVSAPVAVPVAAPAPTDLLTQITPTQLASLPAESFQYGAIFGPAGSGKTHLIRETLKLNPRWGLLTATTGVAASILGPDVPTMHSALGDSAVRSYNRGTLVRNCRQIRKNYDRIVVDEMSMLNSKMFDIIFEACRQADLGIVIVGDFLLTGLAMNVRSLQCNEVEFILRKAYRERRWRRLTTYVIAEPHWDKGLRLR